MPYPSSLVIQLIQAYVPEAEDLLMSDAFKLAQERDTEAAKNLAQDFQTIQWIPELPEVAEP